jgi:hypothetical protein
MIYLIIMKNPAHSAGYELVILKPETSIRVEVSYDHTIPTYWVNDCRISKVLIVANGSGDLPAIWDPENSFALLQSSPLPLPLQSSRGGTVRGLNLAP